MGFDRKPEVRCLYKVPLRNPVQFGCKLKHADPVAYVLDNRIGMSDIKRILVEAGQVAAVGLGEAERPMVLGGDVARQVNDGNADFMFDEEIPREYVPVIFPAAEVDNTDATLSGEHLSDHIGQGRNAFDPEAGAH